MWQSTQALVSLLTLALSIFGAVAHGFSQGKIALIVTVGDYPVEGGWQKINSENDADIIAAALVAQGFDRSQIAFLKNAEATRAGILQAIRTQLLERADEGTVAYFQFSGHGQQVLDDNGDEVDGFDEAIVPYDSPLRYQAGVYRGENLIRDEELGELFRQIRRRIGPRGNLLAVLDACHSGTGTRGLEAARGTSVVMGDSAQIAAAMSASRGAPNSNFDDGNGAANADGMAPMVAFFGAAANQLNFETHDETGRKMGSLSYALARKLSQAQPTATYRGLFEQVRAEMSAIAPRQQPQVEGSLDQEIMGGRSLGKATFFRVARWDDSATLAIGGGWLHGLNEGTVIGFFPPETRRADAATPLAKGQITQARPTESTVALETELPDAAQAKTLWAYVLEQSFGDMSVNLGLRLPDGSPLRAALAEKSAAMPFLKLDGTPPEIFAVAMPDGGTQLVTANDYVLENLSPSLSPGVAATRILNRAKTFIQGKFLRSLELGTGAANAGFELVPVDWDERTSRERTPRPTLASKTDAGGTVRFRAGDFFKIRVTNTGERAAFFTLLDIQPDNVVNILAPGETETPEDFRVAAGQSVELPRVFKVEPPLGAEVFKLVATEQPIDLRPIAASRGGSTRDNKPKNPFEALFAQTYLNDAQSRGITVGLGGGAMSIVTFPFVIEK